MPEHIGEGEIAKDYRSITLEDVVEDCLCTLASSPCQGQVVRVLNVLSVARPYIPESVYEGYKARYREALDKKRDAFVKVVDGHGD